ncbi:unnamed protein product [Amoebophrya sp. A120]|nr:unnamed protein product [Amoebophrya sp. A120]|eukprot:GSA120T00017619001.1
MCGLVQQLLADGDSLLVPQQHFSGARTKHTQTVQGRSTRDTTSTSTLVAATTLLKNLLTSFLDTPQFSGEHVPSGVAKKTSPTDGLFVDPASSSANGLPTNSQLEEAASHAGEKNATTLANDGDHDGTSYVAVSIERGSGVDVAGAEPRVVVHDVTGPPAARQSAQRGHNDLLHSSFYFISDNQEQVEHGSVKPHNCRRSNFSHGLTSGYRTCPEDSCKNTAGTKTSFVTLEDEAEKQEQMRIEKQNTAAGKPAAKISLTEEEQSEKNQEDLDALTGNPAKTKQELSKFASQAAKTKLLSQLEPNLYDANWAASWDSTYDGTTIRPVRPDDLHIHHNRDDGAAWASGNPDASFPGTNGTDVPTPIRISVTAESPYQPQDLPLVAIKMFQPKSGKPTGVLKITSPDVHTFLVPEMTFL